MNKIITIFAILIIAAVFLAACTQTPAILDIVDKEEPLAPTSLSDCQYSDQYQQDDCHRDVAKLQKDKSICTDIQTDFVKDLCYHDVACETGDISICEMFENELTPTHSNTVLCYKCAAIANNDDSLCELVRDIGVREDCYSSFK